MDFKLWSELNPKIKGKLKPDLELRNWNSLILEEKYKIWKFLEHEYFFNPEPVRSVHNYWYEFYGERWKQESKQNRIYLSIYYLNKTYKVNSYARNFLTRRTLNSACEDFYRIFIEEDENVVLELLSFYCRILISESKEEFDRFAECINEVFCDWGINVYLTQQGFVPRQEEKIIKEIYEPVLKCLSNSKWKEVDKLLSNSFKEYRRKEPEGYSNCITSTISAIQAFLQIIVYGKTGKGNISDLIIEAQKKNLIPNDFFTKRIFENIESIFAKERQETSIAHPPKEYATEKNARTILNLAMIFLQHCIQK